MGILLDELAIKNNTDKASIDHGYMKFYDKYIGGLSVKKLLELGIYSTGYSNEYDKAGASLKTWYGFYPEATIIGVDLLDFSCLDNDRIHTIAANSDIRNNNEFERNVLNPILKQVYNQFVGGGIGMDEIIKRFGGDYDVIIDDGGHTVRSNQTFLGYMFPYLKKGGVFVIEDLHVTREVRDDQYNSHPHTEKTTLWVLKNFMETGEVDSIFMTDEEKIYLKQNIENITIEMANYSEIAFIVKK